MKKICILAVCLCVLTACAQPIAPSEDIPERVALITPAEVGDAVGVTVGEPQFMWEEDVAYSSENGSVLAQISVKELTAAEFAAMRDSLSSSGTVIDAPHLGEVAFFDEASCNLMVYSAGRAMNVCVTYASHRPNDSLVAARQLAALTLERW